MNAPEMAVLIHLALLLQGAYNHIKTRPAGAQKTSNSPM
jgi:hypothetical protein